MRKEALLCCSVTAIRKIAAAGNPFSPSVETRLELGRVRISRESKLVGTDLTIQSDQKSATLFYVKGKSTVDAEIADCPLEVDDRVQIDGEDWRVNSVKPVYGLDALHHWEVGLV